MKTQEDENNVEKIGSEEKIHRKLKLLKTGMDSSFPRLRSLSENSKSLILSVDSLLSFAKNGRNPLLARSALPTNVMRRLRLKGRQVGYERNREERRSVF